MTYYTGFAWWADSFGVFIGYMNSSNDPAHGGNIGWLAGLIEPENPFQIYDGVLEAWTWPKHALRAYVQNRKFELVQDMYNFFGIVNDQSSFATIALRGLQTHFEDQVSDKGITGFDPSNLLFPDGTYAIYSGADFADAASKYIYDQDKYNLIAAIIMTNIDSGAVTDMTTADAMWDDLEANYTAPVIISTKSLSDGLDTLNANLTALGTSLSALLSTDITDFTTAVNSLIASQRGTANGVASLDSSGLVPSAQLPSFVDDVLEYANLAAFPGTGATGKIYIALDTNAQYRYSGSTYIELVASPGTTDNVPEGTTNLYFTPARALASTKVYVGTTLKAGAFPIAKSGTLLLCPNFSSCNPKQAMLS